VLPEELLGADEYEEVEGLVAVFDKTGMLSSVCCTGRSLEELLEPAEGDEDSGEALDIVAREGEDNGVKIKVFDV